MTLHGLSVRVGCVAAGEADFGISTVPYLLAAQSEARGLMPVRCAAVFHQRSPLVGVVRADSGIWNLEDLPGRRTAGHSLPWFVHEYEAALELQGAGSALILGRPERWYAAAALGSREIEVVPTWVDTMPLVRRHAGCQVRAVSVGLDIYATALLAADRLPSEVVRRFRDALSDGFALQSSDPEIGVEAYSSRFPDIPLDDVRDAWLAFKPYGIGDGPPCSMDEGRWDLTAKHTAFAHGLPAVRPDRLYRPELLSHPSTEATSVA